MSATARSLKIAFCLAVVVALALAIISPSTSALAFRRQERLPAELSLPDAIAIYLERHAPERPGDSPSGDKDIASDEARRRGIQRVKEAFHKAVFAQYLIGEAESERRYFDELFEIAQARADVGAAPESDVAKVRHERARAEEAIAELNPQLRKAMIRLAGLVGAKDFSRFPEVTGNLNITPLISAWRSWKRPWERICLTPPGKFRSGAATRSASSAFQAASTTIH